MCSTSVELRTCLHKLASLPQARPLSDRKRQDTPSPAAEAAASTAAAKGCVEWRSSAAAYASSCADAAASPGCAPFCTATDRMDGLPTVKVPVLSKATTSTCAAASSTSPPRMSRPLQHTWLTCRHGTHLRRELQARRLAAHSSTPLHMQLLVKDTPPLPGIAPTRHAVCAKLAQTSSAVCKHTPDVTAHGATMRGNKLPAHAANASRKALGNLAGLQQHF